MSDSRIIIEESIKQVYLEPEITLLNLRESDIITESHTDPNMGEWDTN